ncbi:MAG: hypothetical protein ACREJ0_05000 [Geminicoccaceae bacterium]
MRPSPEPRSDEGPETGPEDLTHLSVGELLVIWALRVRLARGPSGPVAGFRLAFGISGVEAALASFEGLFGVLRRHCRCDIGLHAPGCRCVGLDEMTLAGVIAALQAGAALHARALAARLVDAAVLDGFLDHAHDLAVSLKEERLHLPVRPLAGCDGGQPSIH